MRSAFINQDPVKEIRRHVGFFLVGMDKHAWSVYMNGKTTGINTDGFSEIKQIKTTHSF